jgi:hypothetical protein
VERLAAGADPLDPPLLGHHAVDPYLLGSESVGGHAVWVVSFVTPQVPAWFTIWIDKKTHRTLELRMTAAGQFMHHRYSPFNAPLTINPPGRR